MSSSITAFTAVSALLVVTPGADTALLARNALQGGRRAAVATVLGSRLGLVVHALLAALGLSALLATSAQAYQGVKFAGAGYLIWLGVRSLHRAAHAHAARTPAGECKRSNGNPWLEGFLTNLLNPKTALFYLAVLPQFIHQHHDPVVRSFILAAIHIGLSLVWYLGLALTLAATQRRLTGGRVRRTLDAISGTAMLALGVRLVLDRS